ncbi:XRE family transcriptional regulator [uncultured Georgenia sp.]|uniref:helix-turn-helix domain-containing protein n=1 Tax=uncultured Georgenia sp. TaxID=378209 RepID=UPI002603846B|nr:XRE family transcriptional regulator [uncultured Georgenia sp.]HLV04618.1 helix-turn-helix domain-containing protein [Actinomycetaceae bacterium]
MTPSADPLVLGRRIRHARTRARMTLRELAAATGSTTSHLSLVENGRREPRLSLLTAIAQALDVTVSDLLAPEPPPDRRAELEIALERAQRSPLFSSLGIPPVRPGRRLPLDVLESLVALHQELDRRARAVIATPLEARRINTEQRLEMQRRNNYLPEIEELAEEWVRAVGYTSGALTHHQVALMAERLGFTIIHVDDLPHSTRTVTDLRNGRIYLPPASIPGGYGLRSLALQAMAHRLFGHERPRDYGDFLRQRQEIAYFTACCLMPRFAAVAHLTAKKKDKDLAMEDFRDSFGVTHHSAAQRFTNLATELLGIPVHFIRTNDDGALYRGYENDGVPLPTDASGAIEGQLLCRRWAARAAFERRNRTTEFFQYTDTPAGTFWCSTQTGTGEDSEFSITLGVPFAHAKWFRGRETSRRATSTCPDEACCKRPDPDLAERWRDYSWPSAKMHAHVLSPLPSGSFPGVDDTEVFEFLESHAAEHD